MNISAFLPLFEQKLHFPRKKLHVLEKNFTFWEKASLFGLEASNLAQSSLDFGQMRRFRASALHFFPKNLTF
jgi:hypothetical protein